VRLLLDEMIPAFVAVELRRHGHEVVALQEPEFRHLRGVDDLAILQHAQLEGRALVTDNVPDLVRCHRRLVAVGQRHHGLLLFSKATFPRHGHATFVSRMVTALDVELQVHPKDDDSAWVRWLL
jgi:hypothetical protein